MITVLWFRFKLWFNDFGYFNQQAVKEQHLPEISETGNMMCVSCGSHWPCVIYGVVGVE